MGMRSDRIILAVSLLFLIGALSLWWQGAFASDRDDLLLISGKDAQNGDGKLGERLEDGAMGGPAGTSSEDRNEEVRKQIFVHVTGAVKSPGVYTLFEGQRVYEVLDLAEPLDDADVDLLNLAGVLYDQDKIYVPKKGEVLPGPDASSAGGAGAVSYTHLSHPANLPKWLTTYATFFPSTLRICQSGSWDRPLLWCPSPILKPNIPRPSPFRVQYHGIMAGYIKYVD